MAQGAKELLTDAFAKDTWTIGDYNELLKAMFDVNGASGRLRESLAAAEAQCPDLKGPAAMKIGIARLMLSRFAEAIEALNGAPDNMDRRFFQGICRLNLREYDKAAEAFEAAKAAAGADADEMNMRIAEAQALSGDSDTAAKAVARPSKRLEETSRFHYVRGLVKELQGFGAEAAAAYEQARLLDPACAEATFRLAYYLDLHGAEDEAMALYQECVARPPVRANALLNLAVLYDDAGQYEKAIQMARRVLAINPNHPRALMMVKDAAASKNMFYDEEQAKRQAYRSAILDTPVTDFELSVRARNCLKKMDIRTLGDLVATTEASLMSYKNFGETSLKEIKEMLSAKGLSLGQASESELSFGGGSAPVVVSVAPGAADGATDGVTVGQVEFSIRVRRALETLGIRTLGELAAKSETDLMACPNFGQTSVNEVHAKLAEHGLRLAEA